VLWYKCIARGSARRANYWRKEMSFSFESNIERIRESFSKSEISRHESDNYIYIFIEQSKKMNKKAKLSEQKQLFSIIAFGVKDYDDITSNDMSIDFSIVFTWKKSGEESYYHSFPEKMNRINAPQNIKVQKDIKWNRNTNTFSVNGKSIDIIVYIKKQYRKHILPSRRIFGFSLRILRVILWELLSPFLNALKEVFLILFFIVSGKTAKYKETEYSFTIRTQGKAIIEHTVEEGETQKIDFFGMTLPVIPVLTYSSIHLLSYLFFYLINIKPKIIVHMIENSFLLIIYVIVSFTVMNYSRFIFLILGKILLRAKTLIERSKIPCISIDE
jgi:hypothetical protein